MLIKFIGSTNYNCHFVYKLGVSHYDSTDISSCNLPRFGLLSIHRAKSHFLFPIPINRGLHPITVSSIWYLINRLGARLVSRAFCFYQHFNELIKYKQNFNIYQIEPKKTGNDQTRLK